ncbi:MAG: lamin tail domain-containing protein [Myxococcales bacterium]|nr:lamin tail domain-containing protein [Myxococcales bacterium]
MDAAPADAALLDAAALDAAPEDAALPDAALPDAAPLDAALPDAAVCVPAPSWSRGTTRTGGVVVINELAFEGEARSWIELANPLALDVDLSGWSLSGDVGFSFPDGTLLPSGGFLVVAGDPAAVPGAIGPLAGTLDADRGEVVLLSNSGRRMDEVDWSPDPVWPARVGGWVKTRPTAPASLAESWHVARPGGTPGVGEPPPDEPRTLVPFGARWRIAPDGADFADPAVDDGAWAEGQAPFFAGRPAAVEARVRLTADNHFAAWVGPADGQGLRPLGRDAEGAWQSAEDFVVMLGADDHLFVAGWEARGDAGSPQMMVGDVVGPEGLALVTSPDAFEAVLGPADANPGPPPGAPPTPDAIAAVVAAADADGTWQAPAAASPLGSGPWGNAVQPAPDASAQFIWLDTFDPASATNLSETYALFRSRTPVRPPPAGDELPAAASTRLRITFDFDGDPATTRLRLALQVDDAAVVWLNGQEVYRVNLPAGPLAPDAAAIESGLREVGGVLPAGALRVGRNVLAVDVRQAGDGEDDLAFDARLDAEPVVAPAPEVTGAVVINEIMYHPPPEAGPEEAAEWLELHNPTEFQVDLEGWRLVDGVRFTFPAGAVLPAGGYLVVARDAAAFAEAHPGVAVVGDLSGGLGNSGERLALHDACGELVDEVRYVDGGRWPAAADGEGASLELRDPRADNAVPGAWAASAQAGAWEQVAWEGVAGASAVGPDGQWEELVLGLLGAGEILIDDVSVVADPGGAARELIEDGGFDDAALATWRALGTHRHVAVVPDPDDPQNPVLHLRASGATEHMHNHLETTLAGGARVENGTTYRVSLRARWLSGSNQLNGRLYFNRLPRTTRLTRPASGGTPGAENSARAELGPTLAGFTHQPAVPAPGTPATVSVVARDADGVAAVTLWWAVDGDDFAAVPMALEDGRYTAAVPGQPAGTLVQVYVEAEDGAGVRSVYPAGGPDSRALIMFDAATPAPGGLPKLRLLMTAADQARFHADVELMSNDPTGVTVIFNESEIFHDIGVRAKGSQRGRPTTPRLGFSLRFGPEHPFLGAYETVSVDRSEGVRFGQRELLMDAVATRAGTPFGEYNDLAWLVAPRAAHTGPASLQLARFGDLLLDNQFEAGGDGMLFEYELVYYPITTDDGTPTGRKRPQPDRVVGSGLRDLGEDPEGWRHTFLIKNNRKRDDYSGIMAFARVFGLPDDAFRAQVADVIDVDQWLEAAAVAALSGAVDHYGAGAQHNVQFYVRPDDARVLYAPHDLDFYPGEPTQAVVANRDLGRLLGVPAWRRLFYRHLRRILAVAYDDATLARWQAMFAARLPSQDFASHIAFMRARAAWVERDAPDSIERAIPPVAFAVLTPDGVEAVDGEVTIEGTAWLDVAAIEVDGEPVEVVWTGPSAWRVVVAVEVGEHLLQLEALDDSGQPIAGAALTARRLP